MKGERKILRNIKCLGSSTQVIIKFGEDEQYTCQMQSHSSDRRPETVNAFGTGKSVEEAIKSFVAHAHKNFENRTYG
jgi:hypothetical protein